MKDLGCSAAAWVRPRKGATSATRMFEGSMVTAGFDEIEGDKGERK